MRPKKVAKGGKSVSFYAILNIFLGRPGTLLVPMLMVFQHFINVMKIFKFDANYKKWLWRNRPAWSRQQKFEKEFFFSVRWPIAKRLKVSFTLTCKSDYKRTMTVEFISNKKRSRKTTVKLVRWPPLEAHCNQWGHIGLHGRCPLLMDQRRPNPFGGTTFTFTAPSEDEEKKQKVQRLFEESVSSLVSAAI